MLGKDYRLKARSASVSEVSQPEKKEVSDVRAADRNITQCLRAPDLETVLVDMFEFTGYFAILATSFKWLKHCSSAVNDMPVDLAAAALVLTGANFEGLTAPSRRNLLSELSDLCGHSGQQIIGSMAKLCNAYQGD